VGLPDRTRLENVWLGMFCSALAGYKPDTESLDARTEAAEQERQERQDPDEEEDEGPPRDGLYIEDAINYAEALADGGLEIFKEKFGRTAGGTSSKRGKRDED
jgi:hypothetical protein